MAKFQLGKPTVSRAVHYDMEENPSFAAHVRACFARHSRGDWGECKDPERNDLALENGARIFSVYEHGAHPTIWIITEADRSSTTVLYPSDY